MHGGRQHAPAAGAGLPGAVLLFRRGKTLRESIRADLKEYNDIVGKNGGKGPSSLKEVKEFETATVKFQKRIDRLAVELNECESCESARKHYLKSLEEK